MCGIEIVVPDILGWQKVMGFYEKMKPWGLILTLVHAEGLEPTHLSAPDPKSGAATNYATRAGSVFPYSALPAIEPAT